MGKVGRFFKGWAAWWLFTFAAVNLAAEIVRYSSGNFDTIRCITLLLTISLGFYGWWKLK